MKSKWNTGSDKMWTKFLFLQPDPFMCVPVVQWFQVQVEIHATQRRHQHTSSTSYTTNWQEDKIDTCHFVQQTIFNPNPTQTAPKRAGKTIPHQYVLETPDEK